jgi:hypothetical protein
MDDDAEPDNVEEAALKQLESEGAVKVRHATRRCVLMSDGCLGGLTPTR